MFLISERRECSSETDNRGTTTLRTKIYIYTLSCQWDVVPVREECEDRKWWNGFLLLLIFFFPPPTNHIATQLSTALLEKYVRFFLTSTADSIPQNVLSALNFSNCNSKTSVRATCDSGLCDAECLAMEREGGASGVCVCCRFGRTVWSIYMCSSTLIYLLFTKSIHTVHPQISMIQLVAPSQTVSEMLDGRRERWKGWTSNGQCFL